MPTETRPRVRAPRLAMALLLALAGCALPRGTLAQAEAFPPPPYVALGTIAAVGEGRCLEANGLGADALLGGESFLDLCHPVTGQAWRAAPEGGGRFRLQAALHGDARCLAVNGGAVPFIPEGAPYMAACEDGASFEAVATGPRGFLLRAGADAAAPCLTAEPEARGRALRLAAAPCDGRPRQLWTLRGGRLIDGVPSAGTPGGPALPATALAGRSAECLWNDGTTDRPMQYPCRIEPAPDASGFAVIGDDHLHRFTFEPDAPGLARGVLHLGRTERPSGRFERSVSEITCWTNAATGERLCFR